MSTENLIQRKDRLLKSSLILLQERDAIIAEATDKLRGIEKIVLDNENLRNQLKQSLEALRLVDHENSKIRENIERRQSAVTDFGKLRNEYEARRKTGQLSEADEIMMLKQQIQALENQLNKVDVLRAENDTLKLEIEQLRKLQKVNQNKKDLPIPTGDLKKETSKDVDYLQKKIDSLQNELKGFAADNEALRKEIGDLTQKHESIVLAATQRQSLEIMSLEEERERLRLQLDRMVGFEEKLLKLKASAEAGERCQKECDTLRNRCTALEDERDKIECRRRSIQDELKRVQEREKVDKIQAENVNYLIF